MPRSAGTDRSGPPRAGVAAGVRSSVTTSWYRVLGGSASVTEIARTTCPPARRWCLALPHAGSNRWFVPTMSVVPAARHAATTASASATVVASGFSHSTARLPAATLARI